MTILKNIGFGEVSPVLRAARELHGEITAAADEIERTRHLPEHIAASLKDAGVFGMAMPRAWGGPELDPLTQLEVLETLAMADGSVGWCTMINCDSGYMSAFLEQDVARAMYPDITVATGASATPLGTAARVPGGYRVSGRFPFCSGIHHCEWMFVGCIVTEDGAPCRNEDGVPETRQCFLSRTEFDILDTWHTMGLRGTGSNDVAVNDVFVEEPRTFSFQDPALIKRSEPLYAFPLMFLAKAPGPALGIARHAVDHFIAEAPGRTGRRYLSGDRLEDLKPLAESVQVQDVAARADAMVSAARAHAFQVVGELWETLIEKRELSARLQSRFRTLYPHVLGACVDAVQLVCKAAGGKAVYNGVLERCLRDVLAMNQHIIGADRHYEAAGRFLFGLDPLMPLL
jgi:indole-3-acetate monooxygenase